MAHKAMPPSTPIPYKLSRLLCQLAIEDGDIFVWAFTIMQWTCMARSFSIDDLTFGQISVSSDSLVVEYCDPKADHTGDKTTPNNCYVNPYDHNVCTFIALACYFCLFNETYMSERDTIFRNRDTETGTAAHGYCNKIQCMYKNTNVKLINV